MSFKRITKTILRRCGLDVRLIRNVNAANTRTWELEQCNRWRAFLQHRSIRTVIDVGANTGQFAKLIHRVCPEAKIYSFEPISDCIPQLEDVLRDVLGSKVFPVALGERNTTTRINRSKFTPCSSLLGGTELLGLDYPDAAVVDEVEVQLARMDDVLKSEVLEPDLLVKFDVQGYEIPAIRGAQAILSQAAIVAIEVCFFRQQYKGQPLFDQIYRTMTDLGFSYRGNADQSPSRRDGRIVEADAIFERE